MQFLILFIGAAFVWKNETTQIRLFSKMFIFIRKFERFVLVDGGEFQRVEIWIDLETALSYLGMFLKFFEF